MGIPLILELIRAGMNLEVSNEIIYDNNKILIFLSDNSKATIEIEYLN